MLRSGSRSLRSFFLKREFLYPIFIPYVCRNIYSFFSFLLFSLFASWARP